MKELKNNKSKINKNYISVTTVLEIYFIHKRNMNYL